MSEIISRENLMLAAGEWLARGMRVAGPRREAGRVFYAALAAPGDLVLEGFVHPSNSAKEFVFSRHEKLYSYRIEGNRVELTDATPDYPEQVLVAVRPCDAAAFPILDPLFNWGSADEFYNERRRKTTVVALACAEFDAECFCTSVGLGPASERGADALLLPLSGAGFEVRCLTEKGRALFAGRTETSDAQPAEAAAPPPRFDAGRVRAFAEANFEHPVWAEQSLACLGCGACAYGCPTCHCFDIVDEHRARVRNWDSCQFGQFTAHASGHNPRSGQAARQRQRILHKFSIYPQKFGEILCTGCGNCARNCPAGVGVLPVVTAIDHGERIQA